MRPLVPLHPLGRARPLVWARPLAILLAASFAGCSASSPASPTGPIPSASDSIELGRGPCFGTCPIYTVTVRGDGRVRFVGERFVEQTGVHTRTVDAADVAALFAAADRIEFFDLPADITPANEAACGSAWTTDMPSATVAIDWAERDHDVHHYHGCPRAPDRLTAFEERIDEVADIAEWVGHP